MRCDPAASGRVESVAQLVHRGLLERAEAERHEPQPARAGVGHAPGRAEMAELVRRADPLLDPSELAAAVDAVLARTSGVGRLQHHLADDAISEVMVNGDGSVWVERSGVLECTELSMAPDEVLGIIERVTAPLGLHVDRNRPTVDARLSDGSRFHAVVAPVAVDGPCVTIRRFKVRPVALEVFCAAPVVDLLCSCVRRRANVVVSGGTGAGKTTLLNALGAHIGARERVVTVEDTAELRFPGAHVVRLEARPDGPEGAGGVALDALVRTSLRMRPDRIVVGETRGPEALAMLQAMNTGHEGSLSTLHANSATDALRRLETMVLSADAGLPLAAVREHIAAAVDVVVQVGRVGERRRVVAVDEVSLDVDGATALRTRALVRDDRVVAAPQRPRVATGSGS